MAGKDISDMSFDEFFLGKKGTSKKTEDRPRPVDDEKRESVADVSGFVRGKPKFNVRSNRILLYIPKYEGGKGAKYQTSLIQDGRVVDLGSLKSSPLDSDISSIPTEFDLFDVGISPLKEFAITIDGKIVYEIFDHSHLMFSAEGMPISRAEDTTIVVYPQGKHLWLMGAKVAASMEAEGLLIDTVEVGKGGYIRVRDRPQPIVEEQQKAEEAKPVAKKAKLKPSASIVLPASETVADIRADKGIIPLYTEFPRLEFETKDVDPDSCTVKIAAGADTIESPMSQFDQASVSGMSGSVSVSLIDGEKSLASKRFFVMPGFNCSYISKGDISDDEIVTFTIGSEEYHRNIYEDGMDGPYPFGDGDVRMSWNIPVVTFDYGKGITRFTESEALVDEVADSIVVTVRGAAKKAVFLAGTGKKVNLTPDWEDETVRIDASLVKDAVFDSASRDATLFITVNSCPVRRFLTVTNQADMSVEYAAGELRVTVGGGSDHVCRIFNLDKSVKTIELQPGETTIPVGELAITAEVAELRNGKEINTESVVVRDIPFLLRDDMGDVWFYVSKDKRIPLPDGLLGTGAKDPAEIRKWHSQIVRMNPELKSVSPEKTVKAFKDFTAA